MTLSEYEIKDFSRVSSLKSVVFLFLDWCQIFLCILVFLYFKNFFSFAVCFVFIARAQFAVAVMMHEGSHYKLVESPVRNDFLAQWFAGGALFLSLDRYRRVHIVHHSHPVSRLDPNSEIYKKYPMQKKDFFIQVAKDLLGITFFTSYLSELKVDIMGKKNKLPTILSVLLPQLFIISCFFFLRHPALYFFLYLLPMSTLYQFFLRMRVITEHAGLPFSKDQALVSRTITNPVQAFFFGPHGANYHLEHHLFERVQFYNLRKIHLKLKMESRVFSKNFFYNYFDVIKEIVR